MIKRIKGFISPPLISNYEDADMAYILHSITLWGTPLLLLIVGVRILRGDTRMDAIHAFIGSVILALLVSRVVLRFGYVRSTSRAILILAWVGVTYLAWTSDGLQDNSLIPYMTIIFTSALLLGEVDTLIFSTMCIVAIWGIAYADSTGIRITDNPNSSFDLALNLSVNFSLSTLAVYYMIRTLRKSLDIGKKDIQNRKQTEAMLQEQADYLNALHLTTLGIINRLELAPLLQSILIRALELVDAKDGLIELVLPDDSALKLEVGIGTPSAYIGLITQKGVGLTGRVWALEETKIVNNYTEWEHRNPDISTKFNAMVGLPLKSGNEVIGVLALMYVEPERKFAHKQVLLLERMVSLASLAIQNARLYQAVQIELRERRLAQAALRENEEKFRKVFQVSPVAICISTLEDGRLLEANYAYWVMTGLDPNLSTEKDYIELDDRESRDDRKKFVQRLKQKRSIYDANYMVMDNTGRSKPTLAFYELIELGNEEYVLSMFYDMSEQRQTMGALKESEARMHALLSAIPDMILELTKDGLITNMIPPKDMDQQMLPDNFVNKQVNEVLPEIAASQTLFAVQRAIQSDQMNVFDFEMEMAGKISTIEARVVANNSHTALVILRDITLRKWIEAERKSLINELETASGNQKLYGKALQT